MAEFVFNHLLESEEDINTYVNFCISNKYIFSVFYDIPNKIPYIEVLFDTKEKYDMFLDKLSYIVH